MDNKNKEWQDILERIARENKRVTGALLEKLGLVTEKLIEIIKNHDLKDDLEQFDFKGFGFRWKGSRHGRWIHFCSIDDDDCSRILPTRTSDINTSFYYHNDFHYLTEYMTRDEILTLCEILPEFIQNMISKIQNLTDIEQKFLEKFAK